jgi:hypothetical protein
MPVVFFFYTDLSCWLSLTVLLMDQIFRVVIRLLPTNTLLCRTMLLEYVMWSPIRVPCCPWHHPCCPAHLLEVKSSTLIFVWVYQRLWSTSFLCCLLVACCHLVWSHLTSEVHLEQVYRNFLPPRNMIHQALLAVFFWENVSLVPRIRHTIV